MPPISLKPLRCLPGPNLLKDMSDLSWNCFANSTPHSMDIHIADTRTSIFRMTKELSRHNNSRHFVNDTLRRSLAIRFTSLARGRVNEIASRNEKERFDLSVRINVLVHKEPNCLVEPPMILCVDT